MEHSLQVFYVQRAVSLHLQFVLAANCYCVQFSFIEQSSDNNYNSDENRNILLFPSSTPEELSNAIIETVDTGARIINLSLGISSSSMIIYRELQDSYEYARRHDVIMVIAAGNQGNIGYFSLLNFPWIIPITSCDEYGIIAKSNLGTTIGKRGLMAPGVNVTSSLSVAGTVRGVEQVSQPHS
jgi:subtilisin family serine protease